MHLDKLDPNWSFAQKHGKSCIPGKPKEIISTMLSFQSQQLLKKPQQQICLCCLNVIQKQIVPLCQNSKQLQFLGFGFPLYFIFMKYSIILLLIQTTSYSALSLLWAVQSSRDICSDATLVHNLVGGMEGRCTSWLIWFVRTEIVLQPAEIILRLSSFVIQFFSLVYIRDMISKTNDYYDQRTTSLSDYSVLMKNMPKTKGIIQKIKMFFKEGMKQKFEISDIILLNQMQEYYILQQQKRKIIKKIQKIFNKEDKKQQMDQLKRQIDTIDQKISNQYKTQLKMTQNDEIQSQKAILILQTQQTKQMLFQIFSKTQSDKFKHYFGDNCGEIIIQQAPEPKQIMWQNINYPKDKRIFRFVVGWSLTLIFIAGITGIFYAILRYKSLTVEHILQNIKKGIDVQNAHQLQKNILIITILTILLIIFFNKFILSTVLHFFTDLEKHQTGSDYQFSFQLKYCFGLFFTTALMTLLVQDISFHNIYTQNYGVAEQQSIMFFFNAFLVPIIWLINPWHIYHAISKYFNKGRKDMTQREANKLMENTKFSIGKQYAQLIESIWFVYLYSSLIPGGAPLMAIGFCFYYWVSKYNLLRKTSINQNVNGELSKKTLKLIDASLLFRGIGDLIFDIQIRDGAHWQPILCIVLGFVYLILPVEDILESLHEQQFRSQQKAYSKVKSKFIENYRTLHPLYQHQKINIIRGINLTIDSISYIKQQRKNILNNTQDKLIQTNQNFIEDNIFKQIKQINQSDPKTTQIRKHNISKLTPIHVQNKITNNIS